VRSSKSGRKSSRWRSATGNTSVTSTPTWASATMQPLAYTWARLAWQSGALTWAQLQSALRRPSRQQPGARSCAETAGNVAFPAAGTRSLRSRTTSDFGQKAATTTPRISSRSAGPITAPFIKAGSSSRARLPRRISSTLTARLTAAS